LWEENKNHVIVGGPSYFVGYFKNMRPRKGRGPKGGAAGPEVLGKVEGECLGHRT